MPVRVAIIGPTGYTGLWLIELLLRHPDVKLTYLASHRDELPDIVEEFPQLHSRIDPKVSACRPIDYDAIAREADVAFLGLPHRVAMAYVPGLLTAGLRVVDLSADYRLASAELYESVYKHPHDDPNNLDDAVYGLPELFGDDIPDAQLVANPGCYPTAAALAICPLIEAELVKPAGIIINAASGATGAGRKPTPNLHFAQQNESFLPYGEIGGHRHQPEIEQTIFDRTDAEAEILFVPHLLPVDRGILETIYLEPTAGDLTEEQLFEVLEDAYDEETFVRVRNDLPNVKHVRDTNFCDLTVRLVERPSGWKQVVVFSALDNMIKGASGQAVQNMNLLFGLKETAGLL